MKRDPKVTAMYPYYYALEKLSHAVRILATGEGDVRSRLMSAYEEFHTLREDHFPLELRVDYAWVLNELTKRKPQSAMDMREWVTDGVVAANLRRMINRTGSRIAEKICDLEYRVRVNYEYWQKSLENSEKQKEV